MAEFNATTHTLTFILIFSLLFVSGCNEKEVSDCSGADDATYFDESQRVAEKYMPYFDMSKGEKYELEQVHYRIKRKDDGRTAIEYWAQWNYSQSTFFENLFSRIAYGKKFDHEFDMEPVFVYLSSSEIERITYDAKHYIRGTSIKKEIVLADMTHPIISVIKNSHGYEKFRKKDFDAGKLKTNYTLVKFDRLYIDKLSKTLENGNPPMSVNGIIDDPWCFNGLRFSESIFSIIDRFYGDHSGSVFYTVSKK